jgi:hypothetical protein
MTFYVLLHVVFSVLLQLQASISLKSEQLDMNDQTYLIRNGQH